MRWLKWQLVWIGIFAVGMSPMSARGQFGPQAGPAPRTTQTGRAPNYGLAIDSGALSPRLVLPTLRNARSLPGQNAPLRANLGQAGTRHSSLMHQDSLLMQNSYAGTIFRLNSGITAARYRTNLRQADVDRSLEELSIDPPEPTRSISEFMSDRLAATYGQRMSDGWSYFGSGDYLRAMHAFKMAESVDRDVLSARFGQFMCAIADLHIRQASNRLEHLLKYHVARRADEPGMFDLKFSLADAMPDDRERERLLVTIGQLAETAGYSDRILALYSYLLWYGGDEDSMARAGGVAERIQRLHPSSPWASFAGMIREARSTPAAADVSSQAKEPGEESAPSSTSGHDRPGG